MIVVWINVRSTVWCLVVADSANHLNTVLFPCGWNCHSF